jgi:hypothetical protein
LAFYTGNFSFLSLIIKKLSGGAYSSSGEIIVFKIYRRDAEDAEDERN